MWGQGFLGDPGGEISMYPCTGWDVGASFTAETLPAGVKVCPSLTLGHVFAPPEAQAATAEAARKHGYALFEIDIVPWEEPWHGGEVI